MVTEMIDTALKIDKSNWELTKFGDVVFEPKEMCRDIVAEGIKHVVGLKHIESEDLHLRLSDGVEEGSTFTKKFKKKDVLFGRRRAYLKKAAQAHFDGICSGDITVFRTNEKLLPELLPFIVHNDKFFDYAVKHSAGGLSPRVKFKDLANYEFLLPPKDQQAKLAELLWAMDEVVEKERNNKHKYELFLKRYLFDNVSGKLSSDISKWQEYTFGDLGKSFNGLTGKTKKDFGTGAPYVNYMNVFTNSKVDPKQVDYVNINKNEKQNELEYGDILITGSSETPHEVGMTAVVLDDLSGYYLNSFCFGFRLNDFNTLLPEYARFLLRGEQVRKFMFKHAQGSTRFNLSKITVRTRLKILIPEISEQKVIANILDKMENNLELIESQIRSSQTLQKSLINQIF